MKFKLGHCSPMSNSAWFDLNSKGDILKLHDKCPNSNCDCQKQITFTPKRSSLKEPDLKISNQKFLKEHNSGGINSLSQQLM